jgi:CheY-like chemotaxis protein
MKSVLLVEDTAFIKLMSAMLQGYEVVPARTLAGAFRAIAKRRDKGLNRFSVIVLDLDLPDSPPEQTVAQIPRLISESSGPRVLIVSGYEAFEAASRLGGAVNFLWKLDENFHQKLRDVVNDLSA